MPVTYEGYSLRRKEKGKQGGEEGKEVNDDAPPANLASAVVSAEAPVTCRTGSTFQVTQSLAAGSVDKEGV